MVFLNIFSLDFCQRIFFRYFARRVRQIAAIIAAAAKMVIFRFFIKDPFFKEVIEY